MMFLQRVILVCRDKSTATTPEHLATTTNDDARMPFWLSFITIYALYPSFLVFLMLIRTL
jgi:hypothetical protein